MTHWSYVYYSTKYSTGRHIYSQTSNRSSCVDVPSQRRWSWKSVNGEVEACRFLTFFLSDNMNLNTSYGNRVPSSLFPWLWYHMYLQQYTKYLEVDSWAPKKPANYFSIFLALVIGTFPSRVLCLAIWPISLLLEKHFDFFWFFIKSYYLFDYTLKSF